MKAKKLKCWVCEKAKANTFKCDCGYNDAAPGQCKRRVCRACAWKNRNV